MSSSPTVTCSPNWITWRVNTILAHAQYHTLVYSAIKSSPLEALKSSFIHRLRIECSLLDTSVLHWFLHGPDQPKLGSVFGFTLMSSATLKMMWRATDHRWPFKWMMMVRHNVCINSDQSNPQRNGNVIILHSRTWCSFTAILNTSGYTWFMLYKINFRPNCSRTGHWWN